MASGTALKHLPTILLTVALAVACIACFLVAFTTKAPEQQNRSDSYTVNITIPELGTLEGRHIHGAIQFYGVPYADQPERFKHAGFPPLPWGHRPAYVPETSAPICWGGTYGRVDGWVPGNQGEDNELDTQMHDEKCLYMQISIPERVLMDPEFDEQLPVFVYSHGGNFHSGSSTMPLYEGRYLASIGDIIVISVNYRMDVFGFLPVADVWNKDKNGNDKESVGNFGLTDQQVALHFINKYISAFGGDNTRVTVAGQSAGSESAYLNMLASDSPHQEWYQRVMLMSIPSLPYLTAQQGYDNVMMAVWKEAWERWHESDVYGSVCNKNPDDFGIRDPLPSNDVMNECLYALEDRDLWNTAQGARGRFKDYKFIADRAFQLFSLAQSYDPIIDGNIVFDQDVQAAKDHLPLDKDIMVGSTGDEGEIFVDGVTSGIAAIPSPMTESVYRAALFAIWKFDNATLQEFYDMYPWDLDCARFHDEISFDSSEEEKAKYCDANDSSNQGVRDYLFVCSQRAWLKVASERVEAGEVPDNGKLGNRFFWLFDEPVPWKPPQGGIGPRCALDCDLKKCVSNGALVLRDDVKIQDSCDENGNNCEYNCDGGSHGRYETLESCSLNKQMACHGNDISYVFGGDLEFPFLDVTDDYRKLSRQFQRYISNFVRNGDTNDDSGRADNVWTKMLDWGQEFSKWQKFDLNNVGYMHMCANQCQESMYSEYLDHPIIYGKEHGKKFDINQPMLDHGAACDLWDRFDEYGLH